MGFASGSVTFRRYKILGDHPDEITDKILKRLAEFTLQVGEYGVPDEVEYGWSGGRHLFDQKFTFEHNVFAECIHFAIRIDTNRVPSAIKKAYEMMEEESTASGNPSGHISKKQKKDVKDVIRAKIDEELKSGKYRRSKLIPILWDFNENALYGNISGSSAEKMMELFERTFELETTPVTAGSMAMEHCESIHKVREYEDLRPTRFVTGPAGESQFPDYPWTAKGPQPKDFLGNEMLLWLWRHSTEKKGVIATPNGDVTVVLNKQIDLDCAYGQTGKDTLRGDGVTRMPEAADAVQSGKMPRKAGMLLEFAGIGYDLGINPESLSINSAVFPDVEEADEPRVIFEERIGMLRTLVQGLDGLMLAFLAERIGAGWEAHSRDIRKWIETLA
jgi:hypothetical protein